MIQSQSTPIPEQWGKYILNPRNKENLADYLSNEICLHSQENLYLHHLHQKVVLAEGFIDKGMVVSVSQGYSEVLLLLPSDHEEADTRILLHAKDASHTSADS